MLFVCCLATYFGIGLLFSIVFFLNGYKKLNPDAAGTKLRVRLLWAPGAMAIWPLLVYKWCKLPR